MRLYLLRHAEARDRRSGERDFDRELTARGMAQAASIARAFAGGAAPLEVRPTLVRASAALRARATAEAVASALGLSVELEEAIGLDADADEAMTLIRELAMDTPATLLVGHNPTFSDLAAMLAWAGEVRKAECVVIEIEAGGVGKRGRLVGRIRGEDGN